MNNPVMTELMIEQYVVLEVSEMVARGEFRRTFSDTQTPTHEHPIRSYATTPTTYKLGATAQARITDRVFQRLHQEALPFLLCL